MSLTDTPNANRLHIALFGRRNSGKSSLINALTIGIPSFILALEPNTNIVRGKFLRNVLYRAAPAGITDILVIMNRT